MKRYILFFFFISFGAMAQEVNFFNTNQSLINLNPSYAGSNGFFRNQTAYRAAGVNTSGNGTTLVNSADVYVNPIKGGIAATCLFQNEMDGLYKSWSGSLAYSQHISLCGGDMKLVPSVQLGYFLREMDIAEIHFEDYMETGRDIQWPGHIFDGNPRKSNITVSSGLLVQCNKGFSAGAYFFNLNQPDQGLLGEEPLPLRSMVHAAYSFKLGEKNMAQIFSRFTKQQNRHFVQLCGNTVLINHVIAGVGGSTGNNGEVLNMNAGFRANYFSVVLGHDIWFVQDSKRQIKSWELSVSFNLQDKENRKVLTAFENM